MKVTLYALFLLAMPMATPALAQATHEHGPAATAPSAEARQAFDALKSLAGSWVAKMSVPGAPDFDGRLAQFSMEVTSRGNALLHEFSVTGIPDHPITMFYLDGDLALTHYCDAGNRPQMIGTLSPDGKTLTFEFAGLSGGADKGHMHRAVFTFIDENHHTEEWTFMMPGDKPMPVHFDLRRTNFQSAPR